MTTVLVVDDEPDIRLLVRLTLESVGYDVEEAAGGAAAVSRLLEPGHDPDVVVLDMRMPAPDGWAVLDRLGEAGRLSDLRVVAASAHSSNGAMTRALDSGCVAYVKKPFLVNELRETVARALELPVRAGPDGSEEI